MLTTRRATRNDLPLIQHLGASQGTRWHAADPRLPEQMALPSWHIFPVGGTCWLAEEGGKVCGALFAEPEYWSAESALANVFPRQYLRLRIMLQTEADTAAVLNALLDTLDRWAVGVSSPGRMMLTPVCDDAMWAALEACGFTPYHTIAFRGMEDASPPVPETPVIVRPAARDDLHDIARLMAESWRFHADFQPAIQISRGILDGCIGQTRRLMGNSPHLRADSNVTNQLLLLAERADEAVGFFAIGISEQRPALRPAILATGTYGDITEVAVRADQRRTGIGMTMFAAAREWFAPRGVQGMFVNYAPTNPLSSRFWPRLGFSRLWVNWWRSP